MFDLFFYTENYLPIVLSKADHLCILIQSDIIHQYLISASKRESLLVHSFSLSLSLFLSFSLSICHCQNIKRARGCSYSCAWVRVPLEKSSILTGFN